MRSLYSITIFFLFSFSFFSYLHYQEQILYPSPIKTLCSQFCEIFFKRDLISLSSMLNKDCSYFDSELKWSQGRENVLNAIKTRFNLEKSSSYELYHLYEEGNISILEFMISNESISSHAVFFLVWKENMIIQLRSYY